MIIQVRNILTPKPPNGGLRVQLLEYLILFKDS